MRHTWSIWGIRTSKNVQIPWPIEVGCEMMGSQWDFHMNKMGIGSLGLNEITLGFLGGQDFVDKMSIYFVVAPIQTDHLSVAIVEMPKSQSH